jgi:hypothetical protein
MQQPRSTRLFTLLTGLLFAGLALTVSAQGQSPEKGLSSAISAARPAESYSYVYLDPLEGNQHGPKVDDGQHQGLQVHGHWIIDVKNPDGTVAQHRDFENQLQTPGAAYLIGLMAGYIVPNDYAVFLSSSTTQGPCTIPSGGQVGCVLVHSLTTAPAVFLCQNTFCASGLTYNYSLTYATSSSFTMAGSFTASRAGNIDYVGTWAGGCPSDPRSATSLSNITPVTCSTTPGTANSGAVSLTAANITPVSVVASQIVQVTVVITIS